MFGLGVKRLFRAVEGRKKLIHLGKEPIQLALVRIEAEQGGHNHKPLVSLTSSISPYPLCSYIRFSTLPSSKESRPTFGSVVGGSSLILSAYCDQTKMPFVHVHQRKLSHLTLLEDSLPSHSKT